MGQEPGPTRWLLPDPRRAEPGRDVIAQGGGVDAATLLAGYRLGVFPMPDRRAGWLWCSPDPRGVLPAGGFRASRSLRRSSARFTVSVDQAFEQVLAACADPSRPGAWIRAPYNRAYRDLHSMGWAHSVEVWYGGVLAGGLIGVEVGGLFCGETMFHLVTDASKIAVWTVVDALAGEADRVFDVQWCTPHLASLGVTEVPRDAYLDRLPDALALPPLLHPMPQVPAQYLRGLQPSG